ncbi:hypothetical protein PT974_09392 [Cladobotryum mycophilum]|uniref:DUF8035 domain-containing protein n=1 Tax=Cladobotryum mycophilum TaxID=491253 RepID=A0ABR0SGK2_9HYPO
MAYQDRDFRRTAVEFDDVRRVGRSPAPSRRGGGYEEVDVRVRERERETDGLDFMRRRPEAGPMVLRQREVETVDHHARDRSPVYRERIVRRAKSVSPPHHEHERERSRTRVIERERERVRAPSSVRRRSPSPNRNVRYVDPPENEHIHTPAPIIRGPVIEREVITHYTDVDHGMISLRQRSPPAPVRRREQETRETDIDISVKKGRTEVDIHRSTSRTRSKSRERRSSRFYEDDLVVRRDLKVEEPTRRRARSVGAQDEESEYITSKVDSRGRMGEAHGGATKHWTIVDVPPGTERIRMDGIGGGVTDTTFSKYSGVRRTKFLPDRDGSIIEAPTPPPASGRKDHRLSVAVYDHEREIDIEKVVDRRISRSPAPPPKEMWTEITKDLVSREAIEELGYEYEETEFFFYVMEYLRYDDVLQLTELSDEIRRSKRQRAREVRYEREYWDETDRREPDRREPDRRHYDLPRRQQQHRWDEGGRERVRETEVIYDNRAPGRGFR